MVTKESYGRAWLMTIESLTLLVISPIVERRLRVFERAGSVDFLSRSALLGYFSFLAGSMEVACQATDERIAMDCLTLR